MQVAHVAAADQDAAAARGRRSAAAAAPRWTCPSRSAPRCPPARPPRPAKLRPSCAGPPPARDSEKRTRLERHGRREPRRRRRGGGRDGRAPAARRRGSGRCPARRRCRACPGAGAMRSSRSGRKTSTPSMRMMSERGEVHLARAHPIGAPAEGHRRADRDARVGDAARQRIGARARPWCSRRAPCPWPASSLPRAALWPKALSVPSPWTESRNSAPKAA